MSRIVRVVAAVDRDIYDVSPMIGRLGLVDGASPEPCAEHPMVLVRFAGGAREAFWPEELEAVAPRRRAA